MDPDVNAGAVGTGGGEPGAGAAPPLDADFDFNLDDAGAEGAEGGAPEGDQGGAPEGDQGGEGEHGGAPGPGERRQATQEEPEVSGFKGHVSNSVRALVQATKGELGAVFNKYPKVRDTFEAVYRRDMAYREYFPTVSEAKAMREKLPNGLKDLEAYDHDSKELEEIDNLFYARDNSGNYSGHSKLIANLVEGDKNAAVALFKSLPKEWHRVDPQSYSETMGRIVGATLVQNGSWDGLVDVWQKLNSQEATKPIAELLGRELTKLQGFVTEKKKSAEQEQVERLQAEHDRERSERERGEQANFRSTVGKSNFALQKEMIGKHPVIKKFMAAKYRDISDQKKADIVEQIRKEGETFLGNSSSFMRNFRSALAAKDTQKLADLQKAAWGQQWFMNMLIRKVFRKEVPHLVSGSNRGAANRNTGAGTARKPGAVASGSNGQPTKNYKENGRWYRPNGQAFTTDEVLRGMHEQ